MSYHTNTGEDSQSRTWGSADGNSVVTLTRERLWVRLLARFAHTCSSLVSGLLLVSSELDVDGELVDPTAASTINATWTALLTSGTGHYRLPRVRWNKSGVQVIEGSSEQPDETLVGRQRSR